MTKKKKVKQYKYLGELKAQVMKPKRKSSVVKRQMLTDCHVFRPDTKSDHDLMYLIRLNLTMQKILNWYFDPPKKILDVTAGDRMIWNDTVLNTTDLLIPMQKTWNVTFTDAFGPPFAKSDQVCDCRSLPFPDQSFDLIVIDLPFIEYKNALERFNIKKGKPSREFYFRSMQEGWIAPELIFKDFWKEANRVSRNGLIVKIGERFKDGYEVPVISYADHYFDNRFNPWSEFKRVKIVGYRGKYSGRGARMMHIQRVLTFYLVYKKDCMVR